MFLVCGQRLQNSARLPLEYERDGAPFSASPAAGTGRGSVGIRGTVFRGQSWGGHMCGGLEEFMLVGVGFVSEGGDPHVEVSGLLSSELKVNNSRNVC